MQKYDIWMEGYRVTGNRNTAQKIASDLEANSFEDACKRFAKTKEAQGYGNFDQETLAFWGCRLFDNEDDARESFG